MKIQLASPEPARESLSTSLRRIQRPKMSNTESEYASKLISQDEPALDESTPSSVLNDRYEPVAPQDSLTRTSRLNTLEVEEERSSTRSPPTIGSQHTNQIATPTEEVEPTTSAPRRSVRVQKSTEFYKSGVDYLYYTDVGELSTYEKPIVAPDANAW